jgi:ligand-binding sensor domain-containing protein/signal transduction histidine kinase
MRQTSFRQLSMPKQSWTVAAASVLVAACLLAGRVAADPVLSTNTSFLLKAWTTEEGLPQNEVTCLLQSRDDYLWLGTPNAGLVRFDGIRFAVFDESNTPGLTNSAILSLFEDDARNLWIGTGNGVALMSHGRVVDTGIGRGSRDGQLASACQDPSGAVWLYLRNGQLWRWASGHTNLFTLGPNQPSDYRGLVVEASGLLWVGTGSGMTAINWKTAAASKTLQVEATQPGVLHILVPSREGGSWRLGGRVQKWKGNSDRPEVDWGYYPWPWESKYRIYAACEDREGNLAVGMRGAGVYWFNRRGEVTHLSATNQLLSNDYISALCVDREGDLWVGTDGGGLNRIKRALFDVLEPTRDLSVKSVSEDASGGLWIACNGSPLTYSKNGVIRQLPPVSTVLVDGEQRVWLGIWAAFGGGLLQLLPQLNRPQPVEGFDTTLQFVSTIYQDKKGRLWVGSQQGLARLENQEWKTFTKRDGLSDNVIQSIVEDPAGNIWIGTESGGLNAWRDGQFTAYRKSADGLPSDDISSLYADEDGVLWVGMSGAGLARLHQNHWTRYTRREGLVSNGIGYLIGDDQGYLWIGSNAGLMRAPKQSLNDFAQGVTNFIPWRVYGKSDGLPIRECSSGTQPGPCRTRSGQLLFPTIKGLVVVNPAELRPNTNPPPVRIESVRIDGKEQFGAGLNSGAGSEVRFRAGKEQVEIQYSSVSLSAAERTRFKYRLLGHESDWVEVGNTRFARYSRLPPADYQFQVSACNEDGIWNPSSAAVGLIVTPPFWRTWWFLTVAALALLGSVAGSVHYASTQRLQRQLLLLRQQEELEKERSRIARDIHDQLGASLTQVALLGELVEGDKDAPNEVEAHARQISQTARDTTRVLDEIVWAVNPANDTLDGLMTYVCKYSQEYLTVAGLHYRLDAPGQLPTVPIPPEVRHNIFLACKEAVTNVVRHAHATAVWVRLKVQPEAFVIEIEDNGRGLGGLDEKSAQTRNGLRNMRKRMEDIGGEFGFAPAPEGGTLVRLTVPIRS